MKLGIDVREIQEGVYTGIGYPLFNFLEYLSHQGYDDEYVLFSEQKIPFDFDKRFKNVVMSKSVRLFWDQMKLSAALKKEKVDVFFSPYYKIPLSAPCKKVSFIFDLMYLALPLIYRNLSLATKLYYKIFEPLYIRASDHIITCSNYSKQDIINFYNVPEDKIAVIHLSVNSAYNDIKDESQIAEVKHKFGITKRYLLFTGNFKAHKNVETLIQVFKNLIVKGLDLQLVLVGLKTHQYERLERLVKDLGLSGKVIFTGAINDLNSLKNLYSAAQILLNLSFYEGFNLPVAEAMACGTPVIASNRTSFPEVIGDAGILVDPYNIEEIVAKVENLLQDANLYSKLKEAGILRVKQFSQDKICKEIYDLLNHESRNIKS